MFWAILVLDWGLDEIGVSDLVNGQWYQLDWLNWHSKIFHRVPVYLNLVIDLSFITEFFLIPHGDVRAVVKDLLFLGLLAICGCRVSQIQEVHEAEMF